MNVDVVVKISSHMTNRKKRALERDIRQTLYRNLTREGIPMDHIDPTRLDNWPLIDRQPQETDYINLLPPSYRNPFGSRS